MSDATKIYHYESLTNYIKQSHFNQIEVNEKIFDSKEEIEKVISEALEKTMSKNHTVDIENFEQLFSFDVPKISKNDNMLLTDKIKKKVRIEESAQKAPI